MYSIDASFVIDLLRGDAGARAKAERMHAEGQAHAISAPAMAEVMMGAYYAGGAKLKRTLQVLESLEVMDVSGAVALDAALIGAELLKEGTPLPLADLMVAASAKGAGQTILSRDEGFSRIPGLAVERY